MGKAEGVAIVIGATQSLRRVFLKMFDEEGNNMLTKVEQKKDVPLTAAEEYQKWLRSLYQRYTHSLLLLIHHPDVRLQVAGLHSVMDFVKIEWKRTGGSEASFSSQLYYELSLMILTCPELCEMTRDDFVTLK